MPRKTLQLVSYEIRFNRVPLRIVSLELTSSMAASIAGFTERPITELAVNKAPTFTTLGIIEDDDNDGTLASPFLPFTAMGMTTISHWPKTKDISLLFITDIWMSVKAKSGDTKWRLVILLFYKFCFPPSWFLNYIFGFLFVTCIIAIVKNIVDSIVIWLNIL